MHHLHISPLVSLCKELIHVSKTMAFVTATQRTHSLIWWPAGLAFVGPTGLQWTKKLLLTDYPLGLSAEKADRNTSSHSFPWKRSACMFKKATAWESSFIVHLGTNWYLPFVVIVFQLLSCIYSLRPLGLQHTRLPCPSLSPRVYSNSCPLRQWCHPTISSCQPLLLLPSGFPSIRVFSN